MDESGIEATQALDFGDYDDDDDDVTDDENADNSPVAYLNVVCQKGFPGKLFPVYEGDNVIGRGDECKISIPLKALSREHACIEVKGDSHFIYDKGSRNRTRRNKHFLAASVRYELKDKDKLVFGDVECVYQLGAQAADDGDETGSESMFQTAPSDEELDNTTETSKRTEIKLPGDGDYASDASSDILEPTQPSGGNTQSMLGHRTINGNSTLATNITVKETPAAPRTKRFTEDLVLPESGSETDEEDSFRPPPTLAIAADSQGDGDDDEGVKSRMMGAATQAYICESDVTSDDEVDEESTFSKRSLLAAPTQAFVEDDDISTCSEDSPQKKMLLTAATQAFTADTDDGKSTSKKPQNLEPTVAYDMGVGIEPTQAYDMDVDNEDKDEKEENKSSGILFEPTQAYLGKDSSKDKDDDKSDTSEEFVLEGDTDAEGEDEEGGDVGDMLAAPTLACDAPGVEDETQVVSTEEPTQVVEKTENDATVAVADEATQVFDDVKVKPAKNKAQPDETVPVTELETQVFDGNNETRRKDVAINEDATQVFDDNFKEDQGKPQGAEAAATQIFDGDATQVFDNEHDTKTKGKKQDDLTAETQVFAEDATQCFDDSKAKSIKESEIQETQVFDEDDQADSEKGKRKVLSKQYEMETQVFDNDDAGEPGEEAKSFDIMAASTFAVTEDVDEESDPETGVGKDDATQVFEDVGDLQTVAVESEDQGTAKQKADAAETVAVADATQVIEEKILKSKSARKKKQQRKTDDTVPVSDDATQVFDETVAVQEDPTVAVTEDPTVAVTEDPTVAIEADPTVAIEDDATVAVTEEDPTVAVNEVDKQVDTVEDTDDATQVFDETVKDGEAELETMKLKQSTSDKVAHQKRTRGNKTKKDENLSEIPVTKDSKNDHSKEVYEKAVEETDSTSVRKSGRTRGKKDDKSDTLRKEPRTTRGKTSKKDESEVPKKGGSGKKTDKSNRKAADIDAATQRYGDSGDEGATQKYGDSDNEGATQRYGDSDNEGATQRYGDIEDDDLTPDLDEIADDKQEEVPVVTEISRGRSPLKSALASPKKKKSPSPKKVQFVSQHSETGSESGEPSRRSKRGNKGKQKDAEAETVADKKPQTKKATRSKQAVSTSKPISETSVETVDKVETPEGTGESKDDGNKVNKRTKRGKEVKTENNVDESKVKVEVNVKSNKRNRKSLDTEMNDKTETTKRKGRTSLPIVLEENESEASKKKNKKCPTVKGSKSGESENKTNLQNKSAILVEAESNVKKKVSIQSLKGTNENVKNSVQKETADVGLRSSRRTKTVVETKECEDTLEDTKRTSRATRAKLGTSEANKTKSSKSDSFVKSETDVEKNIPLSRSKSRKNATNEVEKMDDYSKKRKLDQVKSEGDKREPSPNTATRSRVTRNKTEDNQSSEVKDDVSEELVQKDLKSSAKTKVKGGKGKQSKVETEISETCKTDETKSDLVKDKSEETGVVTTAKGKGGRGKGSKVESKTAAIEMKSEKTEEEVNVKSKRSARSKQSGATSADVVVKEEKQEEASTKDTRTSRSRSLKRKESSSSSNDSQESNKGETPAKRQKQKGNSSVSTPRNTTKQSNKGETPAKRQKQKGNSSVSTPRNTTKQVSTVTTPRTAASNKQLDTSVTYSPTLRKTTTEGGKAKVMFTGVIDEQGEKTVKELGGELVSSVTECTHLITDQVRRTVKFLCCLSRGIPIVSPQWLASSKTSAFFVDPTPFLVRDEGSERKYKFNLGLSIEKASREQVFQGFTFHVTKSVKPDPQHMSDIVKCAGAKCVNKMPNSNSSPGKVVVISCPDDQAHCESAYKAGIPVMTAEFILTGILRQEVDFQSFKLVKEDHGSKRQAASSSQETTSKKRKR